MRRELLERALHPPRQPEGDGRSPPARKEGKRAGGSKGEPKKTNR